MPAGRTSQMVSRTIVLAILSALVLGAAWTWWRRAEGEDARAYVTVALDRGSIAATVSATGTVNPVTMVQVGTYVSGTIEAIDADFNARVTRGQRVAKIDPAPFQVKVAQAEANLANAEAEVRKARADLALKRLTLARTRSLAADALISQNDVDAAISVHEQAVAQLAVDEARVRQTAAALQEARVNLAYTDITSPVDGVVVSRNVDVGQTVAASFQTPTLFLIAQDLTKMQVDTNVSESDIGDIRTGQAAVFTVDAYPERTFQGVVAQVRNAPLIVQNVVTYDVVVAVDNPGLELKPGMTATVAITTVERHDVVRLPLRALRFTPTDAAAESDVPGAVAGGPAAVAGDGRGAPGVWRLEPDGGLRRVTARLGVRNEEHGEVLSDGLAVGDRIVIAYRAAERQEEPAALPGFIPSRRRR